MDSNEGTMEIGRWGSGEIRSLEEQEERDRRIVCTGKIAYSSIFPDT